MSEVTGSNPTIAIKKAFVNLFYTIVNKNPDEMRLLSSQFSCPRMMKRVMSTAVKAAVEKPMKVLFCGHEFTNGFLFSKEAMLRFGNVKTVQCAREDLHNEIEDADVVLPLMCRIGTTELAFAKKLSMVMQFGVGLEGVDVESATKAGVWVCKIPSEGTGNAQSCAEHAIFLALSLLRNVSGMKKSLQEGGLGNPMGRTLYRSTAIVYGYGGIGKQLVNRLKAFEMDIIVVTRNKIERVEGVEAFESSAPSSPTVGSVSFITANEMSSFAGVKRADSFFVCCSQNADNMGFVNKAFILNLKPGVIIVNVARVRHRTILFLGVLFCPL